MAIPVLIDRIARQCAPRRAVKVKPLRTKRDQFLKRDDEMRKKIELAVGLQGGGPGGVLVLLDADRALPCQLGPQLQRQVAAIRPDRPIRVVLAVAEFEAWFLAAASSLSGQEGLLPDLEPPAEPEKIRDAKGWLRERFKDAHKSRYAETIHQPRFSRIFDLDAAMAAPSFAKLHREVTRLLTSG